MKKVFKVRTQVAAFRENLVLASSEQEARDWVSAIAESPELDEFRTAGDFEPGPKAVPAVSSVTEVETLDEVGEEWAREVLWGDNPSEETAESILRKNTEGTIDPEGKTDAQVVREIMDTLRRWDVDLSEVDASRPLSEVMNESAKYGAALAYLDILRNGAQFIFHRDGGVTVAMMPFAPSISAKDIENARREAPSEDLDVIVFAKTGEYHK